MTGLNTECTVCHPGSIAKIVGTVEFVACSPGFRDDGFEMQTCFACQPGTKAVNFECEVCPFGETSTAMAAECFVCPTTQPTNVPGVILNAWP